MVSIIIPTLNEESVLEGTLKNLKKLSVVPHEIIVSDGFSSDKTVEIAKKYADKVVEHDGKTRQNISKGRNAGARAALGEFVVFLDADSRIENPDAFFTEALKQFSEYPEVVAMTVRLKVYPEAETFGDKLVARMQHATMHAKNNTSQVGESTGEFQMIRKAAFDKVGGFREDLITREDADMFQRLTKVGRTKYYPELTVFHSSRRAHKIGWPKLLTIWMINTLWVALFNKAFTKEWKVVR